MHGLFLWLCGFWVGLWAMSVKIEAHEIHSAVASMTTCVVTILTAATIFSIIFNGLVALWGF